MSSCEWMLSSAPIATLPAAAATAAIPAMSSACTGCSKKSSPESATARTYCSASSVLQPWLASDEISAPGPISAADLAGALGIDERLVDADLDLEGGVALGLFLLGLAQIGIEL